MAKASTTVVLSSSPITPPDRRKYEAEVSKISELIKEKEQQIDLVAIDGKNDTEELTQLGIEVESYEDRRSRILIESKTIDEKLRQLGIEIAKHKAESNRLVVGLKYMTEEKYDEQIKKLQFELNSRRYATKDERLLQDEIAYLIEARSKVFDYQTARKSVDSCRNEQDRIRKEKDGLHHEIKTIREKSNAAKDKMNHCRQNLERKREQKIERKNKQDMISKEIRDLHIQRRQLHDDFRHHQLLYMEAMKNNTTDVHHHTTTREDEENDRGTKRKINKTTKPSISTEQNTEEEWLICRTLITYFSRLLETRAGGGDSFLVAPKPEHRRGPSSLGSSSPDVSPGSPSRQLTDISPSDGNFLLRKKETEEEWLPSTRQRKDSVRKDRKKSRKEKRANSKNQQRPLQLNATIFSQFTLLGLRPPTTISDVENTLEVLKQKMSIFDGHRVSVFTTDSEAGDSGIMSSTGISEISEYGGNGLTSGEVTPNTISRNELSPVPTESHHDDLASDEGLIDTTPLNSIKGSLGSKTDTEGSVCSDMSTPTSTPAESTDGILLTTDNQRKVED